MELLKMNPEWMVVWNVGMTLAGTVVAFFVRSFVEEQKRIEILLNKTREEVARDHVTRAEVNQTLDKLAERIDKSIQRLEAKLDDMKKG